MIQTTTNPNEGLSQQYIIIKTIAVTTNGQIYLCKEKKTQKLFVAKLYSWIAFTKAEKTIKENLKNEYDMLRSCANNPFIVDVHNYFETQTKACLILDYFPKGDLYFYGNKAYRLSEFRIQGIMKQLLQALAYLHGKHIIHLDVKLQNIVLDDDDNIKLIDFDMSVHEDDLERRKFIRGTPRSMSPEMVKRIKDSKSTLPGSSADIWGAGVCMFYLLMGYPLFEENSTRELFDNIVDGNFIKKEEDWIDVSNEASNLIWKMLLVDPTSRITASAALDHDFFQRKYK